MLKELFVGMKLLPGLENPQGGKHQQNRRHGHNLIVQVVPLL
jgi:hypothetical protein